MTVRASPFCITWLQCTWIPSDGYNENQPRKELGTSGQLQNRDRSLELAVYQFWETRILLLGQDYNSKPELTKQDVHASFCYRTCDFFPLVFTFLPQHFAAGGHHSVHTPGSISKACHSAWVAESRLSGQHIQKQDPRGGACGWAFSHESCCSSLAIFRSLSKRAKLLRAQARLCQLEQVGM